MSALITDISEEQSAPDNSRLSSVAYDLAQVFARLIQEVGQMLSTEVQELEQTACIKKFVQLLSIKTVKDRLRLKSHTFHVTGR